MELDTKENSEIIKLTVWEDSITIMVTSTKGSLEMIKRMGKAHTSIVLGHSILGAGEMIKKTVMEEKTGMMGLTMKDILKED